MMKRIAAIAVAASCLLLFTGPAALAAGDDVTGPNCLEILDGSAGYDGSTLSVRLILAAPSCRAATYTVTVYGDVAMTDQIASVPVNGDRSVDAVFGPTVEFLIPAADTDGDNIVCFVATTALGGRTYDRAPDTGCVDVAIGTPPAKKIS